MQLQNQTQTFGRHTNKIVLVDDSNETKTND